MAKLLCLLLCIASLRSFANVAQPGDEPYFRLRRHGTLYIYGKESQDFIESSAAFNQSFREMYEHSFGWKLDEEADYILASPRNQMANAYATVYPNIKTVWYPSGVGMMESMAESSWLLTLSSHETAHLYQLNAKSGLSRRAASVFGNPLVLVPFVPFFVQPNFLLPLSFLEGNAVLNESRLNRGGRLHSGEKRAVVLAQIADGSVDASRLINDQFHFPFGESHYLLGGYFQAHLAAKYGIEKTNRFFLAQSEHYIWPLILNQTFRDHFGSSFYQEVHEFVHGLKPLAQKQQRSSGEEFARPLFSGPLNHDATRIWWVSSAGTEPAKLYIFDKASRRLQSQMLDLPLGKIFFKDGKPLSAATEQHNLHKLEYSLYGEGAQFDPRYAGQVVTDQRAGHTVSLDARESWLEGNILLEGEAFDIGHSNPILDEAGHVYYFRQNGSERLLYRDRSPIAKFDGFYGKLTEVTSDGAVYFIGNTDFGSSLYKWSGQEITRVVSSDRVIDARRIADDEFLLIEVDGKGHRVVSSRISMKAERPVVYSYAFTTQNLIPAKTHDSAQTQTDQRPYNGLSELRYSAWDLQSYLRSDSGLRLSTALTFNDPLEYHSLTAGFTTSEFRDRGVSVQYSYSRYLPELFTRYLYKENWYERFDGANKWTHGQEVQLGMNLPILRWQRWDAKTGVALSYKTEQPEEKTALLPTSTANLDSVGVLTNFKLRFGVPTAIGFFPWREFEFSAANIFRTNLLSGRKRENTSALGLRYLLGLPKEFYVSAIAEGAWAEAYDVRIDFEQNQLDSDIHLSRLSGEKTYNAKRAGLVRLEGHKVLAAQAYSARIPVGIHRLAPFVTVQGMALDDDPRDEYPANFVEYGVGMDFEILLLHKIPVRLRYLSATDINSDTRDNQLRLDYKSSF